MRKVPAGLVLALILLISCKKDTVPSTGSFSDSRDGTRYRWVEIGNQTWMAENMAYLPAVSPPAEGGWNEPFYYVQGYEGNNVSIALQQENFKKYGVLYNWKAIQSACPEGWRLASDEDWKVLEDYLGMDPSEVDETDDRTGSFGSSKRIWHACVFFWSLFLYGDI